jgi:thiamine pyrophosphokinase
LLDDYSKVFVLPQTYEKWYPAQTVLSLLPINKVEGVLTHGLAYPLVHESLMAGGRSGSSNHVAADGIVHISHTSGDLLLMECHD